MQRTAAWHRVTARGAWSGRDGAGHGRTAPLGPGSGVSVSQQRNVQRPGKNTEGVFSNIQISVLFLPASGGRWGLQSGLASVLVPRAFPGS